MTRFTRRPLSTPLHHRLDAPTNYFGARKVFIDGIPDEDGERAEFLRYIDDNGDLLPVKHKINHEITALPDSMIDALRCFIVARAIRNLRGQKGQHASMLVNASRFTGIQNLLRNRLHQQLKAIEDAVRVDGAKVDQIETPNCRAEAVLDAGVSRSLVGLG